VDTIYSPRDHFLNNLSDWDMNIPLQTQWVVNIQPQLGIDGFFSVLKNYFKTDHSMLDNAMIHEQVRKILGTRANPSEDGLGMFYAREAVLPEEAIELQTIGMDGANGFLQGSVVSRRSGKRELSLKLLETNLDITDALMRPWIAACGYRGLAEIPGVPSLKANIQIRQYTKGENKPLRKIHNFYDCIPFSCEGSKLNYGEEKIVEKDVGFIYNYYTYILT